MITIFYSYKRASLINMGTKSDACEASYLPRQPIRPAGELTGRRGDELVISINDRDLLQSITIYYKRHDNNRI